jgi:hypothetical protein
MVSPKILPIPGVVSSEINSFFILICEATSISISLTIRKHFVYKIISESFDLSSGKIKTTVSGDHAL